MESKTIIMSSTNDNSVRGILTIFIEDDLLKCRLRTYNLPALSPECKLGIYHEKEVYSANLIERKGVYESSFVGDFFMDKDFYIALIETEQNNQVLLSGGTYQGYYFNDNSVFLNSNEFENKDKNFANTNNKYQFFKQKSNEQINNAENNAKDLEICKDSCDKCEKCKYKEFFYSQQENIVTDSANKELNTKDEQKEQHNSNLKEFISEQNIEKLTSTILPQFENLFNSCGQDEELNKLILNSKFVKIDEAGEQYSIGVIYENEEIKYLCYAIKQDYNLTPPKELGENFQWLPIDALDPLSSGYFVVFQDATDLKIVKI